MTWARTPAGDRLDVVEIARQLNRTAAAVQQFLRRVMPRGERPWTEKPRWTPGEIGAVQNDGAEITTRSSAAVKKYIARHCTHVNRDRPSDEDQDRLTITQVAADLGLSRATVYRLLKAGVLRRFKGGIAETSFGDLLREHPEVVPYSRLPRDQREWLVLNGYNDPSLQVKRPSVRGLLD